MHTTHTPPPAPTSAPVLLGFIGCITAVCVFLYFNVMPQLLFFWDRPDYSHAYIVPAIMAWIFWTDRHKLAAAAGGSVSLGYWLLAATVLLYSLGSLSAIMSLVFFSIWTLAMSLICFTYGNRGLKVLWAFALSGLFAMPWPVFIFNTVSFKLRLISSSLSELMLRAISIPVYREGNIIDLGTIQLEVVDACSGLRYLLPSLLMAVLAGWMFLRRPVLRAWLVLLAVPVSVFANAFRIMITGILCRWFGPAMAEGFFHDFSGWLVYIIALLTLLGILKMLRRWDISKTDGSEIEIPIAMQTKNVHTPEAKVFSNLQSSPLSRFSPSTKSLSICLVVLVLLTGIHIWASQPTPSLARETLDKFPTRIGDWEGRPLALTSDVMVNLGATDAFNALYTNQKTGDALYFLATFYAKQDSTAAAHAPASCLLGSGWSIMAKEEREQSQQHPYPVGRMVLKRNDQRIISNYWFEQRGRVISNEFMNKLALFQDAIADRRTDGGLIRIELIGRPGVTDEKGQEIVDAFSDALRPELPRFFPGKSK